MWPLAWQHCTDEHTHLPFTRKTRLGPLFAVSGLTVKRHCSALAKPTPEHVPAASPQHALHTPHLANEGVRV